MEDYKNAIQHKVYKNAQYVQFIKQAIKQTIFTNKEYYSTANKKQANEEATQLLFLLTFYNELQQDFA